LLPPLNLLTALRDFTGWTTGGKPERRLKRNQLERRYGEVVRFPGLRSDGNNEHATVYLLFVQNGFIRFKAN
jgi:hypothetical protein